MGLVRDEMVVVQVRARPWSEKEMLLLLELEQVLSSRTKLEGKCWLKRQDGCTLDVAQCKLGLIHQVQMPRWNKSRQSTT